VGEHIPPLAAEAQAACPLEIAKVAAEACEGPQQWLQQFRPPPSQRCHRNIADAWEALRQRGTW